MNREIKFRGKRIDNGEWVYGSYAVIDMKSYILLCVKSDIRMVNVKHQIFPESVSQYTGCVDKNGVEIYEDDIVIIDIPKIDNFIAAIIFKNGSFWIDDLMPQLVGDYNKNINVIGNMWENPELLKGETK